MPKVTEIIPENMPEWAQDGIDSGQFFRVCLERVEHAEKQVEDAFKSGWATSYASFSIEDSWIEYKKSI